MGFDYPRYPPGLLAWTTLGSRGWQWSIGTGWIQVTPEPGQMKSKTPLIHNSIIPSNLILNMRLAPQRNPNYRLGLMAGYQEKQIYGTARGSSLYLQFWGGDSETPFPNGEQSATNNVLKCTLAQAARIITLWRFLRLGGYILNTAAGWKFDNDEHYKPRKRITYHLVSQRPKLLFCLQSSTGYYVTP